MEYEYPTEEQLAKIRDWNTLEQGWRGLVDYVESIWWMPDWGFKLYKSKNYRFKKEPVTKLQLHTGGWSGNESIIGALSENLLFWYCWHKSLSGGHYWFQFTKSKSGIGV